MINNIIQCGNAIGLDQRHHVVFAADRVERNQFGHRGKLAFNSAGQLRLNVQHHIGADQAAVIIGAQFKRVTGNHPIPLQSSKAGIGAGARERERVGKAGNRQSRIFTQQGDQLAIGRID